MYEDRIRKDFVFTGSKTVVDMVRMSIEILENPHSPVELKERQLGLLYHVKGLIDAHVAKQSKS